MLSHESIILFPKLTPNLRNRAYHGGCSLLTGDERGLAEASVWCSLHCHSPNLGSTVQLQLRALSSLSSRAIYIHSEHGFITLFLKGMVDFILRNCTKTVFWEVLASTGSSELSMVWSFLTRLWPLLVWRSAWEGLITTPHEEMAVKVCPKRS